MQCKSGAGQLDKTNPTMIFQYIPFADHNAMPTAAPWTLPAESGDAAIHGYAAATSASEKGIKFHSRSRGRTEAGSDAGASNTSTHLPRSRGLDAIGVDHLEPQVQQAAEWISHGAERRRRLGRDCGSYDDRTPAARAKHAFADSLGADGPVAAGDDRSDSLAKGVRWLLAVSCRRQLGRIHG